MAYSLNRAQLIGNCTRDPELRQTSNGMAVATFAIATNRSWRDKATGDMQEKADFHNVVAWGKLAEIVSNYLSKGRKVYVEGRMQTRDWTGEDGQKRYRTEIVAENIILLDRAGNPMGGGMDRSQASVAPRAEAPSAAPEAGAALAADSSSIDDLPF